MQSQSSGSQLIDINLSFGDDGGQDTLAHLKFHLFSTVSNDIAQQRQAFVKEIQEKDEHTQDVLLVFKFEVENGRQRQSFEFIEKGLDQDQLNENTSQMQRLFRRPKSSGRIEMKQGKGFIYVIYRFYHEKIMEQDTKDLNEMINAKLDLDLSIDAVLKGKTEPSRRSFISIKSDFLKLSISSQKLTLRDFLQYMESKGQVDEITQESAFYQLIKNMQVAKFDFKFNSLRRILRYYNRILNHEDNMEEIDHKERVAPLSSKGIFRKHASVNVFVGQKLGVRAELDYKNEEIMMRLVARMMEFFEGL